MPASPNAYEYLANRLRAHDGDRRFQDNVLDIWLEYRDLATEWDADHWQLRTARLGHLVAQLNKMPFDAERLHL